MSKNMKELPVPTFYDEEHAKEWGYRPNETEVFELAKDWREKHDLKPSGGDKLKTHLLLIDLQKDFCFPEGSLYVGGRSGTGAMEDNDRIARFIYKNLENVTDITATMDTHFPYQIFSPSFWVDGEGKNLSAHQEISVEQIRSGEVRPDPAVAAWLTNGNYAWLERQVEYYCNELEKAGKYKLYLWPPHCLLGSEGHILAGVIQEARLFHSFARISKGSVEVKGGNLLTENYSVFAPEVLTRHDGQPLAQKNTGFIRTLLDSDRVIIAGQAASHCVKSSIDDFLGEILDHDEELVKKVYILEDCMSAVAVPDGNGGFVSDFTPQAEESLEKFKKAGMHVVKSTTPISDWP